MIGFIHFIIIEPTKGLYGEVVFASVTIPVNSTTTFFLQDDGVKIKVLRSGILDTTYKSHALLFF